MPKKTRKEKILAQKRKSHVNLSHITHPVKKTPSSPELLKEDRQILLNEADLVVQTYFLQDLKKSLRLIGIIITLEIAIYFGTINNYLSQILKFK